MVKEWLGTGKVDKIRLLEPLKSLVVGGGGWVGGWESDYCVCPHLLLQLLQLIQFLQFL